MKTIILCADDYGQNQAISQAIIALLEKNRLSATSCMTTSPAWFTHAKALHSFLNRVDIGLHFNLTEGRPLSMTLANSHGFLPLNQLLFKAYWRLLNVAAIEAELHTQLDAFESAMGCLPHFIDGHQHIHQLPQIRNALIRVYQQRLKGTGCYLRCVYNPKVYLHMSRRGYIKNVMIQLLGARAFKKQVVQYQIPHNSSFAGVYAFADSRRFPRLFKRFLAEIQDRGIIMCHPGLFNTIDLDVIAASRQQEFSYLMSENFVLDCLQAGVTLGRFA